MWELNGWILEYIPNLIQVFWLAAYNYRFNINKLSPAVDQLSNILANTTKVG